jgi:hypothetical protein
VTFVRDIDALIAESRAAAGDKYVNILGAHAVALCLRAGVLDEVMLSVLPACPRVGGEVNFLV